MKTGSACQEDRVLWSLTNASDDELKCETWQSEAGLHLRFRTSAGVLYTSKPIDDGDVESWTRVWRAYYLTDGWRDSRTHRFRPYRRKGRNEPSSPGPGVIAPVAQPQPTRLQVATEPILRYWTVTGVAGPTITCELVRTRAGLEVRCNTAPARAEVVRSMAEGLALSRAWKGAVELEFAPRVTTDS